jgi:hypothetical protein
MQEALPQQVEVRPVVHLPLDELEAIDVKLPRFGGEVTGRSSVDRGKQGLKRPVLTEAAGVPLHVKLEGLPGRSNLTWWTR